MKNIPIFQSQFNASAAPFVSQQQRHIDSTAVVSSFDMGPKDTSTPTGHVAVRQLPMTMSPHPYYNGGGGVVSAGYDSPISSRSNITRSGGSYAYNNRYPFVGHPSPIYECESEAYRMVSKLICKKKWSNISLPPSAS